MALGSDFLSFVSDSGAAGGWVSELGLGESGWGGGETDDATSRSFSSSFLGFGVSRGPRTFKWELQNSAKQLKSYDHTNTFSFLQSSCYDFCSIN